MKRIPKSMTNIYPSLVIKKTQRVNRTINEKSIHLEEQFINYVLSSNPNIFSEKFGELVRKNYRNIRNKDNSSPQILVMRVSMLSNVGQ